MKAAPAVMFRHAFLWGCAASAFLSFAAGPAAAQDNSACLECHGTAGLKLERGGEEISLYVDAERFGGSVHGGVDCVTCHAELQGIEKFPHSADLKRVDCSQCHEDEGGPISAYWQSTHGQRAKTGDADAPLCQDCHGDHYVLPLGDANSSISPFNIPQMCAQCHAQSAPVARTHNIPQEQVVERYKESIHGEGLYRQGLIVTAVCTSCHTGHNVLPHDDPRSSIHQDNVVKTCMKCHGRIEVVHRKLIAGELWEKEGVVPLCVACHSPHEVRKVFYDTNMSNADCLRCHGRSDIVASSDGRTLFVSEEEHGRSAHGRKGVSCAQCHAGATPSVERSCSTITGRVNCAICHEAAVADYGKGRHGRLHAAGDANAPSCIDCHGKHGVLESKVPPNAPEVVVAAIRESPTFVRNLPKLCAKCHGTGAPAAVRYFGKQENIVENYTTSVHGRGLVESGLTVSATCNDCHSAHKVLPAGDAESTVSAENISNTCGKCHDGIHLQFDKSVHSPLGNPDYEKRRLRGMPRLPICSDCHSSHSTMRTDLPGFQLGVMTQCGGCHEDVTNTYFDTYHGKASDLGDTTRAKCHDCHGAHDILPPSNPASHLSHENIVETCGKCHPGSHRRFAGYLTHATHHDPHKYPALFYAFWGMTILLIGTFAFFGLHTVAWLPRSWKMRRQLRDLLGNEAVDEKQYIRFNALARRLHFTVIISFFGLAITGMTLKFSYTGWAQFLARFLGGTDGAGWIHRVCAIVTFGYFGIHLWDMGRRLMRSGKTVRQFLFGPDTILPTLGDIREFGRTIKWFFGLGPRPPYGAWTYWEKFDYFAVFWGVAIIGTTGLCLWFPVFFTKLLPGWSINVAQIIHSDEALLAVGFIFTIHFFNTHFRPDKFPMDPVIFTGRMSLAELKHDRPRLYEALVASGQLEKHLGRPRSPAFMRLVRVFGTIALCVGVTLILLIIYAMVFAYR